MAQQLFDLLKKDHRQVEQTMEKMIAAEPDQREMLFFRFRDLMEPHMRIEETYFYPLLEKISEMRDLVRDALQEHREARDHIRDLAQKGENSQQWLQTVKLMQKGILHHIEDEEKEVFPRCTRWIDERQLHQVAQQYLREKEGPGTSRTAGRGGQKQTKKQAEVL